MDSGTWFGSVTGILCVVVVLFVVGLDAAGKTTILYKLKLGEIVTTIPTIGNIMLHKLYLVNSVVVSQSVENCLMHAPIQATRAVQKSARSSATADSMCYP